MNVDNKDIDVVVLWVDGSDPVLSQKRKSYQTEAMESSFDDVGGKTRYADIGEIEYCLASVNRFAPFIRKIFIVTDGQNPLTDKKLHERFTIPMEIVDHKVIFEGYEQYLPTFNSRAIETLIWRIPGLSEKFILMNDDFFFRSPVFPQTFFSGKLTTVWATWRNISWTRLRHNLRYATKSHVKVSFKDSLINAAQIMGESRRYLYLTHSPRAMRKSFFVNFYGAHDNKIHLNEDIILRNIRHRFRDNQQFNSQELFYINEYKSKRLLVESPEKNVLYMQPRHSSNYIRRKIKDFTDNEECLFGCVNSLDLATDQEQKMMLDWLHNLVYGTEK